MKRMGTIFMIIWLLSGCINFYDLKNPFRKENVLSKIIRMELYLIRTGDKEFDVLLNDENISSYIGWTFSGCGGNVSLPTYYRDGISKEEFKEYVPYIIENLKETLLYKNFIKYKQTEDDYFPFSANIQGLARFAGREQKNIKLVKATDNYVCVSIKY